MSLRAPWALVGFGLLAACVEPEAGECGAGAGRIEVGAGGSAFSALPDRGADIGIVRGPQGGIHVLVAFRASGLDLNMDVVYRLWDAEAGIVVGSPTALTLRPGLFRREGALAVRNPDLIVLDGSSPDPTPFDGRVLRLEVEAIAADAHACDARVVTLRAPVAD